MATAIGTAPQAFVSRTFAGLLERAQTLFAGGATVQATSPTRMPSPLQQLQQSPATVSPVPEPPLLESRHVEAAAAPLFSGANMQQMAAVECRAPLLYGSPPQAPGANAESSSIPHDAIQVEVARQLAGLKQELENQRARAEHAEALLRAQVADQARSANTQPVGLGSVSGLGMDYTGSMGDSAVGSGLPSVPLPIPPVPKSSSHPNPGSGLIQAAPPPTREPLGLAGVLSGLIGCRTRSQSRGQGSSATPADAQPSTAAVLEYRRRLLAEMETQTLTGMLQGHARSQDVQSEQQSSQTSESDQDEEEPDQVQLAACTSAVPHAPGEIPNREESSQALAIVLGSAGSTAFIAPIRSAGFPFLTRAASPGGGISTSACVACSTDFTDVSPGSARHQPSISSCFRHSRI